VAPFFVRELLPALLICPSVRWPPTKLVGALGRAFDTVSVGRRPEFVFGTDTDLHTDCARQFPVANAP